MLQSCLTLCCPTHCRLPGSSVHGISQTRILEWVTISSSVGSSRPGIEPSSLMSCQEPAWGILPVAKVMKKEAWQNAKAWSGFRGAPWVFLNIYPPKPELACFIVLCFPLFWHSLEKKLTQGFSLLHMKRMFRLKPLWWLSNLPNSWGLLQTCELFMAPNCERHKA